MDLLIIVPIFFFVLGLSIAFFPRHIYKGFCKLGKSIWRTSTFGLTDMSIFYPENKEPIFIRLFGIMISIIGVIFLSIWLYFGVGPNSFNAMRQASGYLKSKYGNSSSYAFSSSENTIDSKNPLDGYCLIKYKYAGHTGTLRAKWTKNRCFIFEENQDKNQ